VTNRNNERISCGHLSIFQTTKPRTACTRLQLMLVLTSFVGSLFVAIALAEGPKTHSPEAAIRKNLPFSYE
jgi:hypothetical protein